MLRGPFRLDSLDDAAGLRSDVSQACRWQRLNEACHHGCYKSIQDLGGLPGIQFLNALGMLFSESDEALTYSLMEIQGFLVKSILVSGLLSPRQPFLGREIE